MTQRSASDPFYEIDLKLEQWGIWSRQDGMAVMQLRVGDSDCADISDDEALEIDMVVASMKKLFPDQYEVIQEYYRKNKTIPQISIEKEVSRKTISARYRNALYYIYARLTPYECEAFEEIIYTS